VTLFAEKGGSDPRFTAEWVRSGVGAERVATAYARNSTTPGSIAWRPARDKCRKTEAAVTQPPHSVLGGIGREIREPVRIRLASGKTAQPHRSRSPVTRAAERGKNSVAGRPVETTEGKVSPCRQKAATCRSCLTILARLCAWQ
jgi:hypothetical protein